MSDWVLRGSTRRQQWELPRGQAVIGRGDEALVQIDDGLVSRRHAVLTVGVHGVLVDDAGSRNGVLVNGQRITRQTPLRHGDHVAIGGHVFVLVDRRHRRDEATTLNARPRTAPPPALPPPPSSAPSGARAVAGATGSMNPYEVLLAGMVDAQARSDAPALAFALAHLLDALAEDERQGGADVTLLRRASTHALRAAAALERPDWIDRVIDVHAIRPRPMHAATIDALEGALERLPDLDRTRLRSYAETLEARASGFGTYEKFCASRLRTIA